MKLAIVGSTSLGQNVATAELIGRLLDQYRPEVVVSGGAEGVDTLAKAAADIRGIPTTIHYPAGKGWPYYKARNILIAQGCDMLIRIVVSDSKTYGSGWTKDYAASLGKPTEEYVIHRVMGRTLILGGDRIYPDPDKTRRT